MGFWFFLKPILRWFPASPESLSPSPSLLLLRPDRLGDFILSAPALAALLQKAGISARATLVVGVPNAQLARKLFPKTRIWIFRKDLISRLSLFVKLLLNHFDAVVDFHSYPFSTTSALMALFSVSPRRVGFVGSSGKNDFTDMIFNWGVTTPPESNHESHKSLLLARRLYPKLKTPSLKKVFKLDLEQDRSHLDKFFREANIKPGDRIIGLHPTLGKEDNRWSPGHYAMLLGLFPARKGIKWLVFHGNGEEIELGKFKKSIEDQSGVVILPTCDLFQMMAVARRCSLVVAGDSGLTHTFALVTRVIAIFGPSDPKRWGPLGIHHPLVLRSADQKCDSIRPEKVAAILGRIFVKR